MLHKFSTRRKFHKVDIHLGDIKMNFEGFQDLISRVVGEWYSSVKKGSTEEEMAMVDNYLSESPFRAKQTKENELAYEKLMDTRMKLYELSYEIDRNHDAYMEFMEQASKNVYN